MADFIVYRYILNAPNSENGAWIEEGVVRDFKADEHAKAIEQVADPLYPDAIRRAHRWDTTEEYDAEPQPAKYAKREKGAKP